MNDDKLISMANQIARFFGAESGDADRAAEAVADHLRRFWNVSMRESLVRRVTEEHAVYADDVVVRAVRLLP